VNNALPGWVWLSDLNGAGKQEIITLEVNRIEWKLGVFSHGSGSASRAMQVLHTKRACWDAEMWTGEIYRHNLVLDVSLQMAAMAGCTESNARSRKDQALSAASGEPAEPVPAQQGWY